MGPALCKIELANRYGLQLTGSSSKILSGLKFTNGLFFLGNNILSVGNNNPGIIEGFDSARYLVTGNLPGNGLLIRENISVTDGIVIFPIGTNPHAYTPGAVHSASTAGDDYYMSVFDSVKANVTSGENLLDSSVNKTWEVGKINRPDEDEVYLYFQHLVGDEGSVFASRRSSAYISRYNRSGWDSTTQQAAPTAGFLTSGTLLPIAASIIAGEMA